MISWKKTTNRIIWFLIFLFALNFYNKSSLILAVIFAVVIALDGGKLSINHKDSTFWVLAFFSLSFYIFSLQNGFTTGFAAFGCPMAYYIGTRLYRGAYENGLPEEQLHSMTIRLTAGMTLHAAINFVYELIRFGGINSGGIHYDFFSNGAQTAATGAATYLTLFAGIFFCIFMVSDSPKERIVSLIVLILAFAYNITLGGRSFFAIIGIACVFSLIIYISCQTDNMERRRARKKVFSTVFVAVLIGLILFVIFRSKLIKLFQSTYLYYRIEYAKTHESQSLFDFFVSSDRWNIRKSYFRQIPQYLWGGRKLYNSIGPYAHDLWLDIFDAGGIIPFVLMLIATTQITIANIRYVIKTDAPLNNKVLIAGVTAAVTAQFFFEPVLTGCRALLFSYFLICGMVHARLMEN